MTAGAPPHADEFQRNSSLSRDDRIAISNEDSGQWSIDAPPPPYSLHLLIVIPRARSSKLGYKQSPLSKVRIIQWRAGFREPRRAYQQTR